MKRLAMILCALAVAAPAVAQDASGQWQLTVTSAERGPRTTTMSLKKAGEKLSGTLVGPQGVVLTLSGTQTGPEVSLAFGVPTENGTIDVVLKGRQDGESMRGIVEAGGQNQGDFTATRSAAAASTAAAGSALDITGTWALEANLGGETRTPTAVLKQEGEKLGGVYKSTLGGESPITGQIKDKAFTFQATLTFDGNQFTIVYKGTVDQSSMKGDVSVGDLGSGTFTGKKQPAGNK